jgi:TonB-dependent SusC/RagA subfamily outer membrane receptor
MAARRFVLLLAVFVSTPVIALAQGTIAGRITASETMRPLAGAQVSIPGTGIGALANTDGRYLLVNVPVGQRLVRVQIIGYGTQERTVAVTTGQSVAADFQLTTEALGLDEIVVTGTVGTVQRRAVANVVGTVNMDKQLEQAAPISLQQMMSGQVAGVHIQVGGGNVGAGGAVLIRGSGSVSLSTQPLLYIDGVRANGGSGDNSTNRLNDINPADIERIEVIKGPAAATLYGTEASNGVIQIITKKGVPGRATVDLSVKAGGNWLNDPEGTIDVNYSLAPTGQILSQHLWLDEEAAGRHMFRTGQIRSFAGNVRGGQERLTYYVSGSFDHEEGYLLKNAKEQRTLRTNLQTSVTPQLDVNMDIGVLRSFTQFSPDQQAGTTGIFTNLNYGTPITKETTTRGFVAVPPEYMYLVDEESRLNRATTSLSMSHRLLGWLSQRAVVGFDWTDDKSTSRYPRLPAGTTPFYGAASTGTKSSQEDRVVNQTFDYNVSASFDVRPDLTSSTSFGVQYFTVDKRTTEATGENMPTPAVSTVSSGAVRGGREEIVENKTFGMFVQETFGWRNQAFLTAALRADGNSAFGESFNAAYYPKVSGTWVVSDADFWNVGFVASLRLRAAWGKSGLQPLTFAATRTYDPSTGPGDQPVVRPGNAGNPDLRPEVGEELELGFDASLFSGRINLEVTRYDKATKDAILQAANAPSTGFSGNRYVNAGEVSNKGWEFKLDTRPLQTSAIQFNLGMTASYNKNKLVDDGDLPRLSIDRRERFQFIEGYPLGANFSKYIATAEWVPGTNRLRNVTCVGGPKGQDRPDRSEFGKWPGVPCVDAPMWFVDQPGPAWMGSVTPSLTVGNNLSLTALWIFVQDKMRFNTTWWKRDTTQRNSYESILVQQGDGKIDPIRAAELTELGIEHPWFEYEDHIRLRDITLAYTLPTSWAERIGASRAAFTVTGRNLVLFKHPSFREMDPEPRHNRDEPWGWQQNEAPLPHSFVTTMRVSF